MGVVGSPLGGTVPPHPVRQYDRSRLCLVFCRLDGKPLHGRQMSSTFRQRYLDSGEILRHKGSICNTPKISRRDPWLRKGVPPLPYPKSTLDYSAPLDLWKSKRHHRKLNAQRFPGAYISLRKALGRVQPRFDEDVPCRFRKCWPDLVSRHAPRPCNGNKMVDAYVLCESSVFRCGSGSGCL